MRVADEGGTPEALTTVDPAKGEIAHIRPQFLPDGRHLLFTITPKDASATPQFAVLDLKQGGHRTVAKGGVNGRYVRCGHLTYVRDSTLFAIPFDLNRMVTAGAGSAGGRRRVDAGTGRQRGLFRFGRRIAGVFRQRHGQPGHDARVGRSRRQDRRTPGPIDDASGARAACLRMVGWWPTRSSARARDLWVFDVQRGTATRLTFAGDADTPVWTRDSKRVFYASTENGQFGISSVLADGSSKPVRLIKTDTPVIPSSLSPDGRTLLYTQQGRIMMVELSEKGEAGTPKPLHDTTTREAEAHISPDGRWVAYTSLESGSPRGLRARVSRRRRQGAHLDRRRRPRAMGADGRELIYWAGGAPSTGADVRRDSRRALRCNRARPRRCSRCSPARRGT